jgi:endonuclease III-like uncharacterized protein
MFKRKRGILMKNIEIKKTVFEIFDKLYEYEGFQNWWNTLSDKEETEIENIVKEIIQKSKNNTYL